VAPGLRLNYSESVLTSPTVVNLQDRKLALQQGRVERILAVLEAARVFPADLYEEDATGDLVAAPEDWAYFQNVFDAFQLELPRDLNAKSAIGSVVYLAGHLGSKIKLRATNEPVYRRVQATLTSAERDYIEALFGADIRRSAELIKQLGVLHRLPSDFA
jgi:hypothetical protein